MGDADSAELEALDRVLTRLALTEEERLASVLDKLLPLLLEKLGKSAAVRTKTLQILQHVNKRVKDHTAIKLPCFSLIDLVGSPTSSNFTVNFALVYLELGAGRLTPGEKTRLIPKLFGRISSLQEMQQAILFRVISATLPYVSISGDMSAWFTQDTTTQDKQLLLSFFLDWMFYQPQQQTHGNAAPIPPGLTPARMGRLKHKDGELPDGNELATVQMAILKLLCSGAFRNEDILPHLIVGKSALRHDVVSCAEQNLARVMNTVDLDEPRVLLNLMTLVVPNIKVSGEVTGSGIDSTPRKLASSQVRERALAVLMKAGDNGLSEVSDQAVDLVEDCIVASQSSGQLRVSAMEFCQILLRKVDREHLHASEAHVKLSLVLRKQVEQVKQFAATSNTLKEREVTYTTLATLAHKFPSLFKDAVMIVSDMMKMLELQPDIRIALQEALSNMCSSFAVETASDAARQTIKATMIQYIDSSQPKARLVVADWLARLFPFQDIHARFVCSRFACDPDLATRQAAVRGLVPELCGNALGTEETSSTAENTASNSITEKNDAHDVNKTRSNRRREKWVQDALKTLGDSARLEAGRLALAWTDDPLLREEHLILTRKEKAEAFPLFDAWMQFLDADGRMDTLLHRSETSMDMQFQLASLLGFTSTCLAQNNSVGRNVEKTSLASMRKLLEASLELKDLTQTRVLHQVASRSLVVLVELHSKVYPVEASWLLGWLAADSSVVRENVAMLVPYCEEASEDTFVDELRQRAGKKVISAAHARHGAVLAIGRLVSTPKLSQLIAPGKLQALGELLVSVLMEATKVRIVSLACIEAIGLAAEANTLHVQEVDLESAIDTLSRVTQLEMSATGNSELDSGNNLLLQTTLITLGRLGCSDLVSQSQELMQKILDALFRTGEQKQAEIQLTVSEALGDIASKSESEFSRIMKRILSTISTSAKNRLRAASAFWLLGMVIRFGNEPYAQEYLEDCHASFASLLRERGELTRECAARGMAWTFQQSREDHLKSELVSSLARHLAAKTYFLSEVKKEQEKERERKAKKKELGADYTESVIGNEQGGDSDEDDDGDESGQRDQPGASEAPSNQTNDSGATGQQGPKLSPLNTVYKEIFQVAMTVGRPMLTYRLLYLSAGDPFWSTSLTRSLRCKVYEVDQMEGFLLDADGKATEDLDVGVVERLIPLLYHYKYELEEHIKNTMIKLWSTVTVDMGSENEILQKYFDTITAKVLENISSTKFRERHSGALALANIIRESPDVDLLQYLEQIWKLSLRLVDDLNEATKGAALILAKEVSSVTVRLCAVDEQSSAEKRKNAKESLNIALPYLLEKGLLEKSKEGQAIAVHTLAQVVKVAKENIRPSITQITVRLLESLSGLEDQTLQYAMFHTNDQGGDLNVSREQLESMRVQASNESPMQRAIDICIDQIPSDDTLDELAPQLAKLARSGVGLPSLAATSRTIGRLAARRDLEPSVKKHAPALLKGLASGLNDRSAMIRKSFASTAAAVARIAEPSSVKEYVKVVVHLYDDPGDEKARLTVANAMRELLARAPDLFLELNKYLLPLLFLARYDDDEDIAEAYSEIWTENAGTVQNGVATKLDILIPYCIEQLQNTKWLRKRQAADGLRDIVRAVDAKSLVDYAEAILAGLSEALPGRLWHGKEAVLRAVADVWTTLSKSESVRLNAPFDSSGTFCARVLLPECIRESAQDVYTCAAFDAVTQVCLSKSPEDPTELLTLLLAALDRLQNHGEQEGRPKAHELFAKGFEALGAAYNGNASPETLREIVGKADVALRGTSFTVAVGVCKGLGRVLRAVEIDENGQGEQGLVDVKSVMNICWRCIVENKNPTAIVAALAAVTVFFEREDMQGRAEAKALAESARTRLQPLLQHRDPAVIHAASKLNAKTNKYF